MPDHPYVVVEDEALAHGFTQIPNLVLRRPDLSPGAKLTYMVLLSYAWQSDSCYPGQDRLAHDMGVTERSVYTYLKQLQELKLVSVLRRGLNQTNVYVLHRLFSGSENISDLDQKLVSDQEPQILPPKKTQQKKTQENNFEVSKGPNGVEKYDDDRGIILNFVADFAAEFADQAPLPSSVSRAQNLYRGSGLPLDAFADLMYKARQITKERSGLVKTVPDGAGRKHRMHYFFAVLEDLVTGGER
jgi:hypothetical protein